MQRTLTEKRALQQLDIPDWRHMTKDKVMDFIIIAKNMHPEIAKAAIEQFPNFSEMAVSMTQSLCNLSSEFLAYDNDDAKRSYELYNKTLDLLNARLDDPNITDENRTQIIDAIVKVIQMYSEDQKDRRSLKKIIAKNIPTLAGLVILVAGSLLGVNLTKTKNEDSLSDNLDDNETDIKYIE